MIELRVQPGSVEAAAGLTEIKLLATRFPGDHELTIIAGTNRLRLGSAWMYDASPECLAQLTEFGEVRVG